MTTEQIIDKSFSQTDEALKLAAEAHAMADRAITQRDELAEALRMCITSLDNARDQLDFVSDSADKARAVLAKIK